MKRSDWWRAYFASCVLCIGLLGIVAISCLRAKTKVTGVDASKETTEKVTAESETRIEAPIATGDDSPVSQETYSVGSVAINGGGGLVAGITIAILALVARTRRQAVDAFLGVAPCGTKVDAINHAPKRAAQFIARRRVRKFTKGKAD